MILAAGAIGSPQLLELSGVGRPELIKAIGAPVVHALPGVGENLQDHLQLRAIFAVEGARTLNVDDQSPFKRAMMGLNYALRRRGPMTMAPSQLGLFTRSSPDYATANIEFHVQPLSLDRFGEPLHAFPAITISVCNLRPESRGSSHAASADPRAAPVIQPNYLSTLADRRVAVDSIRLARRLAGARALARYEPHELKPGAQFKDDDRADAGGKRDRHDDFPSRRDGQDGIGAGSGGGGRRAAQGLRLRAAYASPTLPSCRASPRAILVRRP